MPAPSCSDDEFLGIWAKHNSPQAVANELGISVRQVYSRRRAIEKRHGIDLVSINNSETMVGVYQVVSHINLLNGTILIGSDCHYNPELPKSTAHRAFVQIAMEENPDYVVLNGDIFDLPQISRHHRIGWDKRNLVQKEIEVVQDRLNEIVSVTRGSKHIRTIGNHDLRFDGAFSNLVPQMEGVSGTRLKDHLPGWLEVWTIQVNDPCELLILHRWKSSLHAPLIQVKEAGCSVATGHRHQQSEYDHSYINNKDVYGIDLGTMAELHDGPNPSFLYTEGRPLNWRAGFWLFTIRNGRLLPPEKCKVIAKDEVWFRGKVRRV